MAAEDLDLVEEIHDWIDNYQDDFDPEDNDDLIQGVADHFDIRFSRASSIVADYLLLYDEYEDDYELDEEIEEEL
jgi:hypothetical protein